MWRRFLNLFSDRNTVIKNELKTTSSVPAPILDIIVDYAQLHIGEVASDFKKTLQQYIKNQEQLNLKPSGVHDVSLSKLRINLARATLKNFVNLEMKGLSKHEFVEFLSGLRKQNLEVNRKYINSPEGKKRFGFETGVGALGELAEYYISEVAKVAEFKHAKKP